MKGKTYPRLEIRKVTPKWPGDLPWEMRKVSWPGDLGTRVNTARNFTIMLGCVRYQLDVKPGIGSRVAGRKASPPVQCAWGVW